MPHWVTPSHLLGTVRSFQVYRYWLLYLCYMGPLLRKGTGPDAHFQ